MNKGDLVLFNGSYYIITGFGYVLHMSRPVRYILENQQEILMVSYQYIADIEVMVNVDDC